MSLILNTFTGLQSVVSCFDSRGFSEYGDIDDGTTDSGGKESTEPLKHSNKVTGRVLGKEKYIRGRK